MSPGPATVLTIKTAAASGLRAGMSLSFGLAVGVTLWAAAALAGLSLLFEIAPYAQTGLRVLGGAFLIWVGWGLWRQAATPLPDATVAPGRSLASTFRLGVMTDLANPKALAYFTAVFSGLIPTDPTIFAAAVILGTVFTVELVWYTLVAAVFSRPAPRRAYARMKARTDRIFGAIVMGLGARIAQP